MKQHQKHTQALILRRKAILLAVASVIPALLMSGNAFADCVGSVASPNSTAITVLCNNSGVSTNGNLTNTSSTAYVNSGATVTPGNNTLLQFDGQGRTLNNSGSIINNLVITGTAGARGRTAVLMGNATLNASAATLFTVGNLPTANATTVTLNAAPTQAYVGQTIVFGRYDGDDFSLGEKRIITAVNGNVVTLDKAITADFAGNGTDPAGYKVVSNYGAGSKVGGEFYNNVIINSGTISSQILASEVTGNANGATSVSNTAAVKAVTMSVEGDYLVNNSATGIISVTHGGLGNALAIEEGGTVEGLTINNAGLISAERISHLTLVSVTATGNPTATSIDLPGLSAATVGSVNAINTQEEAEEIEINNSKTGIIRSKGDYSGTIYMRAGEKTIVNEGLIEHLSTDGNHDKGFAIAAVSNPGDVRTLDLENKASGVIKGDILVVNGNALRWYLLSTEGTLDNRLNINSQYGQSDSVITNAGLIAGNFYYSNGAHELINEGSGTITGAIDVDQRNTYDVGGNGTLLGTKSFTFLNAGAFSGDITVRTDTGSEINLMATIKGSGAGSTLTAPSSAVAGFGGTLKIYDVTSGNSTANLATVTPIAATTVHAGEYFKLADTLFGSVLPTVQSDSALVSWVIDKNAAGNLVVGVDSVASAGSLGLTGTNASVINGLLASNAAIGGAVQGLTTAADVQKAAEQLRPEINGASVNSALRTTSQVEGVVDARISETHLAQADGLRGMAAGDGTVDSGVWLQGFGFTGQQDRINNVDGYNANGGGIAAGADTLLSDALRVGAAFSYANTTLDAQGSNIGNNNRINSYQGMLYASWLADGWYLNGIAGIGQHQFDSRRLVNVGGVIDNPKANYDAWQYFGKVELGLPIAVNSQFSVVPVASLSLSYLDQDAYTETSTGGAALSVQGNDSTSFRSGLGGKAFYTFTAGDIKTVLEGRAIWQHEFADTKQDTTASFAAGGSTFIAQGVAIDREAFNLGASLKFVNEDATQSLSLSYDADIRDEYVGHTGKVQARFDF